MLYTVWQTQSGKTQGPKILDPTLYWQQYSDRRHPKTPKQEIKSNKSSYATKPNATAKENLDTTKLHRSSLTCSLSLSRSFIIIIITTMLTITIIILVFNVNSVLIITPLDRHHPQPLSSPSSRTPPPPPSFSIVTDITAIILRIVLSLLKSSSLICLSCVMAMTVVILTVITTDVLPS